MRRRLLGLIGRFWWVPALWWASAAAQVPFDDVAPAVGVTTDGQRLGGAVWADFNGDGWLDLVVNRVGSGSRLLFSDGQGPDPRFTDVTASHIAGLIDPGWPTPIESSFLAVDLDHDGWPELVRGGGERLEIYRNQGPDGDPPFSFGEQAPGTITHQQATVLFHADGPVAGLDVELVGALDHDLDGWLDLVVDSDRRGVFIARNRGEGALEFEVLTGDALGLPWAGPGADAGPGDFGAVDDLDGDGRIDLALRRAAAPEIYLRADGRGYAAQAVPDVVAPAALSGATLLCDFDGNGTLDWFHTGVDEGTNRIYRQRPDGTFSRTDQPPIEPEPVVIGADCADVDHDGDLDLFLARDGVDLLMINESTPDGLAFVERPLGDNARSTAGVFADYDHDGDLDLFVARDGPAALWRNGVDDGRHLHIRPIECLGPPRAPCDVHRPAIGAAAQLEQVDGPTLGVRTVRGAFGHGSMGPPTIHFGLPGGPGAAYVVNLRFPGDPPLATFTLTPSSLPGDRALTVRRDGLIDPLGDADGDGVRTDVEVARGLDAYRVDSDGDGLCDGPVSFEGTCVGGEDRDADGELDPGETDPLLPDTDGDGLDDGVEDPEGDGPNPGGIDPTRPDTDRGGVNDGDELAAGTDPLDPLDDGGMDRDGDGLPDAEEAEVGTDPEVADSDGDGLLDGDERAAGTDPLAPDTDGDGVGDGQEVARGTDPLDPAVGRYSTGGGGGGEPGCVTAPGAAPSGIGWGAAGLVLLLARIRRRRR